MAIEIVDFPINSMVIFQFAMLNYQRVCDLSDLSTNNGEYSPATIIRCFQAETMVFHGQDWVASGKL